MLEKLTSSKYNSRKLGIAIILFIASTTFVAVGLADFDQWSNFNQWIFGIYVSGNLGEHAKDAWKSRNGN